MLNMKISSVLLKPQWAKNFSRYFVHCSPSFPVLLRCSPLNPVPPLFSVEQRGTTGGNGEPRGGGGRTGNNGEHRETTGNIGGNRGTTINNGGNRGTTRSNGNNWEQRGTTGNNG